MINLIDMTPKQHVFLSLHKLSAFVSDAQDLNAAKIQILKSLANIASWEPLLFDSVKIAANGGFVMPNVQAKRHFAVGEFWARLLGPKLDRRKVSVSAPS